VNASNTVVEIHQANFGSGLWYWLARVEENLSITWLNNAEVGNDNGFDPSVALTDSNVVIEVHSSTQGPLSNLWYWIGEVSGDRINWKDRSRQYDSGKTPSVAVNRSGVVVEAHQTEAVASSQLYSWVGQLSGTTLNWKKNDKIEDDSGGNPSIAINNNGTVVLVYQDGRDLRYRIGRVNGDNIDWQARPSSPYDRGQEPSVTLTDDNMVYEVHQGEFKGDLWQRMGRINGSVIDWFGWLGTSQQSRYYDDGVRPRVSGNGKVAVQVHKSENLPQLYADASLLFDRANWMKDNLGSLGDKMLNEVALPASHDAGMYIRGDFSLLGKTQDLDMNGQLSYGVRYFDLRPKYTGGQFIIHHGIIDGPLLNDILNSISYFFLSSPRQELAILKFSDYDGFDQSIFETFCGRVSNVLGQWLYNAERPLSPRLADRTLSNLIGPRGTILVVCDAPYTVPSGSTGIFQYRDWQVTDPENGDLTVFDRYSDTDVFETMAESREVVKYKEPVEYELPRGQIPKFVGSGEYFGYRGTCLNNPDVPCDLFLLSWTLTPPIAGVWPYSRCANKNLVDYMAPLAQTNRYGKILNLFYTDYVEYSRSVDVSLIRNGCAWR
jgi:hypothetical protein